MTDPEIHALLASVLADIAPEADLAAVDPRAPLREELDIDSMDFLKLVQRLHDRTGVNIPETDYGSVGTLAALTAYLRTRMG